MFQSANFDEDLSLNSSQFVSISTDSSINDVFIAVPTVPTVEEEDATRSKSPSKLEKITDMIINAVDVPSQPRLIDQDNQEDNISYEQSELRLIVFGIGLAGVCSLSSLICIVSVFQAFEVKSQNVFVTVPFVEKTGHFPIPHAAFMNVNGDGYMLVFKQTDKLYFDYAWKFKVPDQGGVHTYFMFEDLGNIHIAYSNRKLKMTVIPSSTLKHFIIPKSKLRQKFDLGFSVRMGNFVMIFGGQNRHEKERHQCLLVNDNENKVTTEIWSIKRQVWIEGPYLPLKTGCVEYACGVSINRTHGIILYLQLNLPYCIDAIIFTVEKFEWVAIKKCIITFLEYREVMKFMCSSYLNRNGKM